MHASAPSRIRERGFSLVEMLVVVVVIGVLASIGLPLIDSFATQSKINGTAADFRTFQSAFLAHSYMERGYPADNHNALPAGMEKYLSKSAFEKEAPISGRYNWEGPDRYTYAGVSLTTTNASLTELRELDEILDDGNLATGNFRRTPNGRYTFIIEDGI